MREGEIRALGEIAGRSIARPSAVARDVHGAVTERVFGALGPLGLPVRLVHDTVSNFSYRGVGAVLRAPLLNHPVVYDQLRDWIGQDRQARIERRAVESIRVDRG